MDALSQPVLDQGNFMGRQIDAALFVDEPGKKLELTFF
jgi:hypothetical protein